jgi:hypothetical protein
MGTRSTVTFIDEWSNAPLCTIYQQYDGYLEGVGKILAEFLQGIEVVNGIRPNETRRIANGMGCLAAQYIAAIKTGVGNVYMTHTDDTQEYNYTVFLHPTYGLGIEANAYGKTLYKCSVNDFLFGIATHAEEGE